jgi:acetolactate synthase-1/2/3 large subunit
MKLRGDLSPALELASRFQVADLLVSYLAQLGIDYVFGIPGGAIEPLYNAIARSQRSGGLRPIVARHETGAAFMADGYTRETGKLGVCCATSGPGATNLITGVANAYDNDIPMLVITGQPSLPNFGKGALQESACTGVNTLGMFEHCTRYNSLVSHPEQLEPKLIAAVMRAHRSPRGPVHLTIPLDVLKSTSLVSAPRYDLNALLQPASLVDGAAVNALTQQLQQARKVVLLIGGACGEAIAPILRIAELTGATLLTTPDGKGLINPHHPKYRGVFGFAGHATANATLQDKSVDLILAIGTSMGEWTSSGWSDLLLNERLVHVDESDDHLAGSPMARLHVRGRILSVFEHLLEQFDNSKHLANDPAGTECSSPKFAEASGQIESILASPEKYHSDATPLAPQRVMHELGRLFPAETRYLVDAGNSMAWAIHYLHPHDYQPQNSHGGWLRMTMNFAPMGWAIGGVVGTAAGNPDVPVVCITGDGSMLMSGQEISAAVAEQLTVIYVVLNDAALGMVKHGQRLAGAEPIAFELPPTDFAAMARALGAQAYSVRSVTDFAQLDMQAICSRKGPTLIDVHIDAEEVPPMNLRMRILGTPM